MMLITPNMKQIEYQHFSHKTLLQEFIYLVYEKSMLYPGFLELRKKQGFGFNSLSKFLLN